MPHLRTLSSNRRQIKEGKCHVLKSLFVEKGNGFLFSHEKEQHPLCYFVICTPSRLTGVAIFAQKVFVFIFSHYLDARYMHFLFHHILHQKHNFHSNFFYIYTKKILIICKYLSAIFTFLLVNFYCAL